MRVAKISRPIEYKDIAGGEMSATNDSLGIIEGYLNRTSIIDHVNDKSIPGCFAVTVKDSYARKAAQSLDYLWPFLWSHQVEILPPGGIFFAEEDRKGLFIKAQLNRDIQSGYELYASFRAKTVSKLSMGYRTIRADYEKIEGKSIRLLKEVAVLEGSAVTFPANDLSQVVGIKSGQMWPGYSFEDDEAKENRVLSTATVKVLRRATDGIANHVQAVQSHMTAARFNDLAGDRVYGASSSNESYDVSSALQELTDELEAKEGRMISEANAVKIGQATSGIMRHVTALKNLVNEAEQFNRRAGWPVYGSSSDDEPFEEKEISEDEKVLLKTLTTSLTVSNAIREGRETLEAGMDPLDLQMQRVEEALARVVEAERRT